MKKISYLSPNGQQTFKCNSETQVRSLIIVHMWWGRHVWKLKLSYQLARDKSYPNNLQALLISQLAMFRAHYLVPNK